MVEMPEPETAKKWERRKDASGNQVPLVAVIPVGTEGREQVGTDIVPEVYEAMIPVLREMQPDYVVFRVNCNDKRENGYWYQVKREESSMNDFDLLGEIADVWHNAFEDEGIYAQPICWVEDAVGSSAVLSLSFCNLYTSSEATIGGLQGSWNFCLVIMAHSLEFLGVLGAVCPWSPPLLCACAGPPFPRPCALGGGRASGSSGPSTLSRACFGCSWDSLAGFLRPSN